MKDKIKEMFGKKEEEKKECGCGPECECSCKDEDTKVEETKQEDILAKKDEEIASRSRRLETIISKETS
jgi:molecular chaperone GrpE